MIKRLFLAACLFALLSGSAWGLGLGVIPPTTQANAQLNDSVIHVSWLAHPPGLIVYDVQQGINDAWQHPIRTPRSFMEFTASGIGSYQYRVRVCNLNWNIGGPVEPPPLFPMPINDDTGCSDWSEPTDPIILSDALALPAPNVDSPPAPYNRSIVNELSSVGATTGSFRVDESGAATYTLSVNLPRGIAGNTPELSLNYHSQAGNGPLGVGWSVGGLSSIERCRQTPFQDNAFRAITLSADDRFCLDGQRLVVTSGQYGAIGAVYATEIDSFIEVRSIGGRHGHPDSFEVRRPDGSIAYYGSHNDSRFSVENNVTLSWSLSELSDQLGMSANRIRYHYSNIGGELLINEVSYSSNRVLFNYVTNARPDRQKMFVFDKVITPSALLQSIQVQNHSGAQVYRVELDYAFAPLSGVKRLESITECGLSSQCLRPLRFDWNNASANLPGFNTRPLSSYSTSKGEELMFSQAIDMTGNGLPDWVTVHRQANTFYVRMRENTGAGLASEVQLTHFFLNKVGNRYPFDLRFIDTTGSGIPEIVYYSGSTQKEWKIFSLETNTTPTLTNVQHLAFHDFNGDGLADILLSGMRYQDNVGGTFSTPANVSLQNTGFNCTGNSCQFSHSALARSLSYDLNGDGLNDLIIQMTESSFDSCDNDFPLHPLEDAIREFDRRCSESTNHFWGVFETRRTSSGQMQLEYKSAIGGRYTPANTVVNLQAVDMNGDGIADLLYFDTSANRWRISYSSQNSVEQESVFLSNLLPARNQAYFLQPIDLTGNGVPDIVYYDSRWKMVSYPFTGAPRNISGPTIDVSSQTAQFADMRGNGQLALMVTNYSQGQTQWYDFNSVGFTQHPTPPLNPFPGVEICLSGDPCNEPPKTTFAVSTYANNATYSELVPDKISAFLHGHGLDTTIHYSFLNNPNVYLKGKTGHPNTDSIFDVIGSIPVVSQITSKTGVGSVGVSYAYGGGRIQAGGRGFLGFEQLVMTDLQSGITTSTTYHQNYPLTGMPKETRQSLNGTLLSLAQNTYGQLSLNSGKSVFPYLQRAYEEVFHLNSNGSSTRLSRSLTRYQYERVADRYAQLREVDSHIRDELHNQVRRVRTVNTYAQDNLSRWILSRLTRTRVTHQQGTGSVGSSSASVSADVTKTVVRTSAFSYDSNGLLIEEVIEPEGDNDSYLKTVHSYDALGNRIRSTLCSKHYSHQCGGGVQQNQGEKVYRSTETVYDAAGRYVIAQLQNGVMLSSYSQFNALGQAETITERGVRTIRRFNAFGQLVFTRTQTANNQVSGQYTVHRRSYDRSELSVPSGAPSGTWYEQVEQGGAPLSWTVFDEAGRIVATIVRGFRTGEYSYQLTRYDAEGRVIQQSQPTLNPSSAYWNSTEYDHLSRVKRVIAADGTVTSFNYQGATSTQTISNIASGVSEQSLTSVQNAFGEQYQVTDAAGTLRYEYDATGNLLKATGVDGHSMRQHYNVRGFKQSMSDPDSGSWTYAYNALGELITQTDPRGFVTRNNFDEFGRKSSERIYHETTLVRNTTWSFSDETHSVWGLVTRERVEGSDTGSVLRLFNYDEHGRLTRSELQVGGEVLVERTTYDRFGRVFQQFDASGDDFGLQFEYRSGHLSIVWEARYGHDPSYGYLDTNSIRYFSVSDMDAYGNIITSRAGSGRLQQSTYDRRTGLIQRIITDGQLQNWTYHFDGLGNLRGRRDELHRLPSLSGGGTQAFNETFEYDDLNRLTQVRQGGSPSMTLTYHANGNIRSKSDVQGGATYSYGTRASSCSRTAGPRAVTQVGNQRYCYDAMGNQTHQYNGNSLVRQIEYNALGKASRIRSHSEDSANGSSVGSTRFTYDGSRQQVRRQSTEQGENTTIIQLGNTELILNGNERRYRRNLGNAIVERNGLNVTTRYIYTDHLGNIDVITDESGQMLEKLSFDAFGKRRAVFTLASQPIELNLARVLNLTHQGFTGHQQVDHAGIVQMGGRIYDSHLGRFLQADPFIQAPDNSQNFNRYSYVLNNPLSYTDPSGYFFKSLKKHWRSIASIAVMFVPGVNVIVLGALSGYIATGSLNGALTGAFTAGMGGIPARGLSGLLIQGSVGGLASKMGGGKFAHGFVSAGVSSLAAGRIGNIGTAQGRTVARAVVGGSVSKVTGGKFGNGAFSAGFAQALGEAIAARPGPEMSDLDATSMELSDAMYSKSLAKGDSINGYTLQDIDTTGNLYAGIWSNGDGHTIIAYRGTATLADWGDNLRQAFGLESKQYEAAKALATRYSNAHFTGHSLGGGLAAVSAIRVGGSATLFNSAGLHANTISGYLPSNASIIHYRSSTDLLRIGNALTGTSIHGQKVSVGPAGWHTMSHTCRRAIGACY